MNPNQAERVFELIAGEMEGVKETPFPPKLIEITKEQMVSNFIIGTESTLNRMTSAGASLLLRGSVEETEEIIAKIEAVTAEDVLEAAKAEDKCVFVLVKTSNPAPGSFRTSPPATGRCIR